MQSFTEYATTQNTHLMHVEDLILTREGASHALAVLGALGAALSNARHGEVSVAMKWDGAPAIVFGPDPNDGQFFVATKSAFNVTPKYLKTPEDIEKFYPEPGALKTILQACLKWLVFLKPSVIVQGDILYYEPHSREVHGVPSWVFTPNTLTYAVPKDSVLGERIAGTVLGVALHTMYPMLPQEQVLRRLRPVPLSPELFARMDREATWFGDVMILDASRDILADVSAFDSGASQDFTLSFSAAEDVLAHLSIATIFDAPHMSEFVQRFLHHSMWERQATTVENFLLFLMARESVEIQKRMTPRGRGGVVNRFAALVQHVGQCRDELRRWFLAHGYLTACKLMIIRQLAQSVPVETFITMPGLPDVLRPTGPEGYVVSAGDIRVKLVDRQEFSRLNHEKHAD